MDQMGNYQSPESGVIDTAETAARTSVTGSAPEGVATAIVDRVEDTPDPIYELIRDRVDSATVETTPGERVELSEIGRSAGDIVPYIDSHGDTLPGWEVVEAKRVSIDGVSEIYVKVTNPNFNSVRPDEWVENDRLTKMGQQLGDKSQETVN